MHRYRWLAVTLVALSGLQLAACGSGSDIVTDSIPAAIAEDVEGSEFSRLTLTEKAAQRLGIEVAAVREEQINGAQRVVIPYAAVIYGANGDTWAYTTIEPLVFVRQPITIDYIENESAVLSESLPEGVEVVTVGVSELYGIDTGVGR